MLFIESYNAKSLDRSSVSMIDKYNGRLNIVGMLLTRLSSLIDNLLSLIRDVRNTLGQCKQRVYDNLNQVKEVISGNDITGTDSTITAIETALAAGDAAIAQAEATLEGVQQEMECNETPVVVDDCGETCNEVPTSDGDCSFCNYVSLSPFDDEGNQACAVCAHGDCVVNQVCDEETDTQKEFIDGVSGCNYTSEYVLDCDETINRDSSCREYSCIHTGQYEPVDNCTFSCDHSTPCQETPMPANCTYSCVDSGCNYTGNDCAYGTICNESCDQTDAEIADCGNCGEGYGCGDWSEFCGEVGGGSTSDGDDGCGEDCSEDCSEGACNQYDCSEYDCGEPCGESCGLL